MTRKRKTKITPKKPEIETEYWDDIEIDGKTVRVKVTRYTAGPNITEPISDDDLLEKS
jgi:hypothetical protein